MSLVLRVTSFERYYFPSCAAFVKNWVKNTIMLVFLTECMHIVYECCIALWLWALRITGNECSVYSAREWSGGERNFVAVFILFQVFAHCLGWCDERCNRTVLNAYHDDEFPRHSLRIPRSRAFGNACKNFLKAELRSWNVCLFDFS